MRNLHLEFAYPWAPWLFLLLIPAVLLTLIPYFLLDKRYRKTRNRIVSMVLHMLIMVFAVCVLTGFTFVYRVGNPENEIMLVVDVSDTQENVCQSRDTMVERIIDNSTYDGYRVGVVTFGFTQVYAVPLTYQVDGVYDAYLSAEQPDTTATDIAAALRFAREQFDNPESAKIVLITDGIETDEQATSAIGSIVAQGILVDTVYISPEAKKDTVRVIGVEFPDSHFDIGEEVEISVTVQSDSATEKSAISLYDNGEKIEDNTLMNLAEGVQSLRFRLSFAEAGLHEIRVHVDEKTDERAINNDFCSYYFLQRFDKILIIEQQEGQSGMLSDLLKGERGQYDVNILNLQTAAELPKTVDDLRQYDQIILNNIANADLYPVGLDKLLYSYVYDYGGGLFTVGGSDENGVAHAYNRRDMNQNSLLYQQMLPVQVIDYTPPVGVMLIIDVSGSMQATWRNGLSKLEWAKQGAVACLQSLTERDYIGIVTLDTEYTMVLSPTACTQESYIKEVITSVGGDGGTHYSPAINRAGQALSQLHVDKKHIVIISDGEPYEPEENYLSLARQFYSQGITISVVSIADGNTAYMETLQKLTDAGHGVLHTVGNEVQLIQGLRDDLNSAEIKEVNDEPFHPQVNDVLSPLLKEVEFGDVEDENGAIYHRAFSCSLGGFYGVRARTGVNVVLSGNFEVPLYAQWNFGMGKVGSFMSDLNGRWSGEFLSDKNGQRFLLNAISGLMPTADIHPNELSVDIRGDNYMMQMSIYTSLGEGQSIRASITDPAGKSISLNEISAAADPDTYVTTALNEESYYSRCNFVIKKTGVYTIVVEKLDAQKNVLATNTIYRAFSYSLEYAEPEDTDYAAYLQSLAARGEGALIQGEQDIWQIYENFVTSLERTFDPRWLFMGLALGLFLLDIAVRKFKFKWPHEIVREYKKRKAEKMQFSESSHVFSDGKEGGKS